MSKLINMNKPVYVNGQEAKIIHRFRSGKLAVVVEGQDTVRQFDKFGYPTDKEGGFLLKNEAPETVEYLAFYPNGNVYSKSCCPVTQSHYDLENDIIQVKVTRRNGKIVKKEFC